MFDARVEREKMDRWIHWHMVSSWRAAALVGIAVLAIAGLCFAVLILNQ